MSIKSLMIANVESQHTAEYIANVFWNQNIAQVSSITLIPYLKETEILQMAYIDIEYWCDSEVAYNFLQRLKVPEGEARVIHFADDWWPVQINTHNNGQLLAGVYTTTFSYSYFEMNKIFDDEKIEYALANSKNVTLRAYQTAYVM
jgi:hypothetical protein